MSTDRVPDVYPYTRMVKVMEEFGQHPYNDSLRLASGKVTDVYEFANEYKREHEAYTKVWLGISGVSLCAVRWIRYAPVLSVLAAVYQQFRAYQCDRAICDLDKRVKNGTERNLISNLSHQQKADRTEFFKKILKVAT